MKKLIIPLLVIVSFSNAQEIDAVDLNWKVNDTIFYKTVMRNLPIEKKDSIQAADTISNGFTDMLEKMSSELSNLKYETLLYPDKNNNVDIEMRLKSKTSDSSESIFSSMAKLKGNTVLRGKVSRAGEIMSFFYKRDQVNMISMLFELPTQPVKVGDEWRINVNLITIDQNFKSDTIYKHNVVRLKDLIVRNGEQIALIEYDLKEYVSGEFGKAVNALMSMGNNSEKSTFMSMAHKAIAEFNVTKGVLLKYDGTTYLDSNFQLFGMGAGRQTKYELNLIE